MSTQVSALFERKADAEVAMARLLTNEVPQSAISLLVSEHTGGTEFALETERKTAEGLATGGTVGGSLGALAAGLTAVSTISLPGVGIMAAGPIVAILTGAGAGAIAGGGLGALIGSTLTEDEVKLYENSISEGGILLMVEVEDERVPLIREILKDSACKEVLPKG